MLTIQMNEITNIEYLRKKKHLDFKNKIKARTIRVGTAWPIGTRNAAFGVPRSKNAVRNQERAFGAFERSYHTKIEIIGMIEI